MYVCECGKEFENSQSFNGHKCHCKEHQISIYGENHYKENLSKQLEKCNKMHISIINKHIITENNKIDIWISEKHTCECCGKVMTEKFGSGRFCSRSCANKRIHSEETKEKISKSMHKYNKETYNTPDDYIFYCSICGKRLKNKPEFGMCKKCLHSEEKGKLISSYIGEKAYQTSLKRGTHIGWKSIKLRSYPELFFENVLNNNQIKFEIERPVKHDNSNYFLDFVIEKNDKLIDLEIDGKQHTYKDRQMSDITRDKYIESVGYLVYRIPWNEINSDEGKQLIKNKIDNFIDFYNSI